MNMKRLVVAFVLALSCALSPTIAHVVETPAIAAQKTVKVKGYTRKDGTVVKPYERKAPERKTPASTTTNTPKASRSSTVTRDEQGRIQRSEAARHAFARQTGYPNGRPGWIIDHIVPLACGGADAPSNMQWQTEADAKAKDGWERKGC